MAELCLAGVGKSYGHGADAVADVSLTVADGEFVVLVGPSGCGKSTTLRMIAGLEETSRGRITIGGRDLTHEAPARRGVAMVFQSYALYPHMTVARNLGFALEMAGTARPERERRVRAAAATLQIEPLLERLPRELSGGQRQRVAIGRAIVREAGVLLFDEPLSNLDAGLRMQMRVELKRLHERLRATIVYVTHDQVEAMTLGQRMAVFNAGRIEQLGAPMAVYQRPANRFVAGFLGSPRMNFMPAAAVAGLVGPVSATRARAHEFGIRPEHLRLAAAGAGAGLAAEVELVESLGDATLVHCRVPGVADAICVKAAAESDRTPAPHSACKLQSEPRHWLAFDAEGRALDWVATA
ncbi:MAG: ATP-binding cassette domain-containing protein [Burkholderiales bacterium]|nr:ATP-binding cassette domain-containing protein [Burkholderiales bacterium]